MKMKQKESGQKRLTYTFVLFLQVDVLERDVLEVLSLVRSMKNNFAPVNWIPGAVLSLIPHYWERQYMDTDKDIIALTHVCRAWRELFTSHPSLWTRLDFTNVDKTHAYIERSRWLPLEVTICKTKAEFSLEEALLLAIPHIARFKSLTIIGASDSLQNLTKHLNSPAPFLKELIIDFNGFPAPFFDENLLNGDLTSLHTLSLGGVITSLPWRGMWNLTTFTFRRAPQIRNITMMQLLLFLKNAPRLRDIILHDGSTPIFPEASLPIVSLPDLKNLTIFGSPSHVLLSHLSIPDGALLFLEFDFHGDISPLPHHLPKTTENLKNLFRVTAVNLCFDVQTKFVRLAGPSGQLWMRCHWENDTNASPLALDRRILRSLDYFHFHMTWSLTITKYDDVVPEVIEKASPYQVLLCMKDLHTLTLIRCSYSSFVSALNPDRNCSKIILCPGLKELVLYVDKQIVSDISRLMDMTRERALRGAKLRSITIVGVGEILPGREVFQLKEHVEHVEYRVEENPPSWDSIPSGKSS